jgi:Aldehyde ferredoxin oxidoreductase, domains 2 & 3
MTAAELRQAGECINTLKKLFNIREGRRQEDDTLPSRVLTEPLPTGVAQGVGLTKADLEYDDSGLLPRAPLDSKGPHSRAEAARTGGVGYRT